MYNYRVFDGQHRSCLILIALARGCDLESIGDKLSSSVDTKIRSSPADGIPADKPTRLSRIKSKSWTV